MTTRTAYSTEIIMIRIVSALLLSLVVLPGLAMAQTRETVRYYHTDAIGSVRAITDEAGQVVARYDFLPFGEEWSAEGNHLPLQFAGKERAYATGFDYFGGRYYTSNSGRFTTVDPITAAGSASVDPQLWNRYAYARNNPLRFTDPDGRCIDGCVLEAAAALTAYEYAAIAAVAVASNPRVRAAVAGAWTETATIVSVGLGAARDWIFGNGITESISTLRPGPYAQDSYSSARTPTRLHAGRATTSQ